VLNKYDTLLAHKLIVVQKNAYNNNATIVAKKAGDSHQ
jgi:hypothetical protein